MFNNKKNILFITKSKIRLIKVAISKVPKEETVAEFEWTPSTFESTLIRIKKMVKGGVKIILSEDFVYEALITFPKESHVTHDAVLQKAKGIIPEDLEKTIWTFKQTSQAKIQLTAIVWSLFDQIAKSIAEVALEIDEIEPLSYAIARFTKGFKNPFLFIYIEDKAYLVLAYQQIILVTERIENLNKDAVKQFVGFAKDNLNIDVKDVIFCGRTQNINLSSYQSTSFRTEMQNISPAVSLAAREKLKEHQSVLSMQLLKFISVPKKSNTFTPIMLGFGFVIVIVIVGITITNIQNTKNNEDSSVPTKALSPTTKPSSTTFNKSDYSIVVLNGSGIAGQATKTKKLLEDEGFSVLRIGNAGNHNFEKTEVRFKDKVPNDLILLLDKTLTTLYDFSIREKLEEKSPSDILIIIGKE